MLEWKLFAYTPPARTPHGSLSSIPKCVALGGQDPHVQPFGGDIGVRGYQILQDSVRLQYQVSMLKHLGGWCPKQGEGGAKTTGRVLQSEGRIIKRTSHGRYFP